MKYQCVCIAVSDIERSRKFYVDLFNLEIFQDYGANVSFSCGISLQQRFNEFIGIPAGTMTMKAHNMELYFEEDDFDEFIWRLEQYPDVDYLTGGVSETRWGQRIIRFYDPDGYIIEVGESLKMIVQRFLASGMSMAETSKRMDVSIPDLERLLDN